MKNSLGEFKCSVLLENKYFEKNNNDTIMFSNSNPLLILQIEDSHMETKRENENK